MAPTPPAARHEEAEGDGMVADSADGGRTTCNSVAASERVADTESVGRREDDKDGKADDEDDDDDKDDDAHGASAYGDGVGACKAECAARYSHARNSAAAVADVVPRSKCHNCAV